MVRASKSTEKSTTTPVVSAPVAASSAAEKPKAKNVKAVPAPVEPVN